MHISNISFNTIKNSKFQENKATVSGGAIFLMAVNYKIADLLTG